MSEREATTPSAVAPETVANRPDPKSLSTGLSKLLSSLHFKLLVAAFCGFGAALSLLIMSDLTNQSSFGKPTSSLAFLPLSSSNSSDDLSRVYHAYESLTVQAETANRTIQTQQQELAQLKEALKQHQQTPKAFIPDKMIVVAQFNEDFQWLDLYVDEIPHVVYTRTNPKAVHNLEPNLGNEASVYMKYIVDHYDNLPENVLFLQAHQETWHIPDVSRGGQNGGNIIPIINKLKWGVHGFASIGTSNWNKVQSDDVLDHREAWAKLKSIWPKLFQDALGDMPPFINRYCCAMFLVKKERILLRPKSFYQRALDWLLSGEFPNYWSGRMFEHTWGIIFGEPHDAPQYPGGVCHYTYC
eukprot:GILJ01006912.1.p1 GENE.GILJ01006912.1~~GILJ01006912.1.p1  ORF type:complete len:356 (-),score=38.79 GILJ01006912.1:153-1220(-)